MNIYCIAQTYETDNQWSVFILHNNKWVWQCAKGSPYHDQLIERGHHFFLPARRFEFYDGMYYVGEPAMVDVPFIASDLL